MEIERFLRETLNKYADFSTVNLEVVDDGSEEVLCCICEKPVLGIYIKFDDNDFCHLLCLGLPPIVEGRSLHVKGGRGYSTFTGELKNKGKEDAVCFACKKPVMGPGYEYSAPECKFLLHQTCAELPLEMQHPFHSDHTLSLREANTHSFCWVCGEDCCGWFSYSWEECRFTLDFSCAAWPIQNKDDCRHVYRPIFMKSEFSCDDCGVEEEGIARQRNICQLLIHGECGKFSRMIRTTAHRHSLFITYSLQEVREVKEGKNTFCNLCYEKIKTKYGAYFCKRCDYVAHLECAYVFLKRVLEECDGSGPEDEEEIGAGFEEGAESIQHFGHNHTLSLSNEAFISDKRCDACVGLISAPFYSCSECKNFFLHNKCVHLPKKKKHSIHKHPLTLISRVLRFGGVFRCDACWRLSQGFSYECGGCGFIIDVKCFSMPENFEYEGHSHTLFLAVHPNKVKKCSACGHCHLFPSSSSYPWLFVCTTCEFALCFECATLSFPAWHRFDGHPLKFRYVCEANGEDYYCLICEKERSPKNWIYYCEECDFSAHIECVLGRYPYINFGSIFKWKNQEHPLTFVPKDELSPPCGGCGGAFYHAAIECATFKFSVHPRNYCMRAKGLRPLKKDEEDLLYWL